MTDVRKLLTELVPQLYEEVRDGQGMPVGATVAGSNQCHVLTRELFVALTNRGLPARRELHRTSTGMWHFVIAHAGVEEPPSQQDVITDLNPWQFMERPLKGYLHDERFKVQLALSHAGAESWYVGLRGIATIAEAHRMDLMPDNPDYHP